MIYWIKKGGRLIGIAVFFTVFFIVLFQSDMSPVANLLRAFTIALISGALCWFIGVVICDILLKGVVTDLDKAGPENLLEGGLLQRFEMMQERLAPGGEEMPFVDSIPAEKKKE
jgi:hypothetical protein